MKKERLFIDNETGEILTESELLKEFNELKATEQTDAETFAEYINNCMSYNNGTLDEIE